MLVPEASLRPCACRAAYAQTVGASLTVGFKSSPTWVTGVAILPSQRYPGCSQARSWLVVAGSSSSTVLRPAAPAAGTR